MQYDLICLYRDFGQSMQRIWYIIMSMRGDAKDVVDTIYANIMHGKWDPGSVKPLLPITFNDTNKKDKSR